MNVNEVIQDFQLLEIVTTYTEKHSIVSLKDVKDIKVSTIKTLHDTLLKKHRRELENVRRRYATLHEGIIYVHSAFAGFAYASWWFTAMTISDYIRVLSLTRQSTTKS